MRPRTRDVSEVSCCIKYLLFSFNVFFWLVGIGVLGIGIWAWLEKEMFQNLGKLTEFFFDPGLIFILVGSIIFIIGFAGCIGSLRENTCLLMFFMVCLIVILLLQVTAAVLLFVYKDWVTEQASIAMKSFISKYRDDPDLQDIIDWMQDTWLRCCGVEGPDDWDENMYFSCSSLSREHCGVPFSCCKVKNEEAIINLQCGYDVRNPKSPMSKSQSTYIYTTGCIDALELWLESNMIPVAGTAVGIAVIEILGIVLAKKLRDQVFSDIGHLEKLRRNQNRH